MFRGPVKFLHMTGISASAGIDTWRCRPSRPSVRSPLVEGSARTSSWRVATSLDRHQFVVGVGELSVQGM